MQWKICVKKYNKKKYQNNSNTKKRYIYSVVLYECVIKLYENLCVCICVCMCLRLKADDEEVW